MRQPGRAPFPGAPFPVPCTLSSRRGSARDRQGTGAGVGWAPLTRPAALLPLLPYSPTRLVFLSAAAGLRTAVRRLAITPSPLSTSLTTPLGRCLSVPRAFTSRSHDEPLGLRAPLCRYCCLTAGHDTRSYGRPLSGYLFALLAYSMIIEAHRRCLPLNLGATLVINVAHKMLMQDIHCRVSIAP